MVINYAQGNSTIWDSDVNAVMNALAGFGTISGCSISKGTGDWDIDVTSGTVFVTGTGEVSISSGTVTITDSSALTAGQSRITLITAQTGDALNDTDGSAATNPDAPDIPSDEVLLGFVVVSNGDSTVADSDIVDVPVLLGDDSARYQFGGSHALSFGMRPIETQTPSAAATADFKSGFGNHQAHVFVLHNVIPATDAADLFLRTSTDGGSNWDSGASDYQYATHRTNDSGTESTISSTGASEIKIGEGLGSAAGEPGYSGTVTVFGTSLAKRTMLSAEFAYVDGGNNFYNGTVSGKRDAAEDVTGVRFLLSTGNIESGTIEHLGVN